MLRSPGDTWLEEGLVGGGLFKLEGGRLVGLLGNRRGEGLLCEELVHSLYLFAYLDLI